MSVRYHDGQFYPSDTVTNSSALYFRSSKYTNVQGAKILASILTEHFKTIDHLHQNPAIALRPLNELGHDIYACYSTDQPDQPNPTNQLNQPNQPNQPNPADQPNQLTNLTTLIALQTKIISDTINHFKTHNNAHIYKSPGFGKTYIVGQIIKLMNPTSVLIVTSRILICEEFKQMSIKLKLPTFNVVNTEYKNSKFSLYCITTYTGLNQSIQLQRAIFNYELIVFDEAHHVCAVEFRKILDLPYNRRLFLTATPKIEQITRYEISDNCFTAEQNMPLANNIVADINLAEDIRLGVLSDYYLYLPTAFNILDTIIKLSTTYHKRRIIVYYNTCVAAKQAHDYCEQRLNCEKSTLGATIKTTGLKYRLHYITTETNGAKIALVVSAARSLPTYDSTDYCDVIFNVNIVAEGVSILPIDSIVFAEPRYSSITLMQNIGRGLRVSPGKAPTTIVVPAAYDQMLPIIAKMFKAAADNIYYKITADSPDILNKMQHTIQEVMCYEDTYATYYEQSLAYEAAGSVITSDTIVVRRINPGQVSQAGHPQPSQVSQLQPSQSSQPHTTRSIMVTLQIGTWCDYMYKYKWFGQSDSIRDSLLKINYIKRNIEQLTVTLNTYDFNTLINLIVGYEQNNVLIPSTMIENYYIIAWLNKMVYMDWHSLSRSQQEQLLQIKRVMTESSKNESHLLIPREQRVARATRYHEPRESTIYRKRQPLTLLKSTSAKERFDEMFALCEEFEQKTKNFISRISIWRGENIGSWLHRFIAEYYVIDADARQKLSTLRTLRTTTITPRNYKEHITLYHMVYSNGQIKIPDLTITGLKNWLIAQTDNWNKLDYDVKLALCALPYFERKLAAGKIHFITIEQMIEFVCKHEAENQIDQLANLSDTLLHQGFKVKQWLINQMNRWESINMADHVVLRRSQIITNWENSAYKRQK